MFCAEKLRVGEKITAMRNYSVRTNEAKAKDKIISFSKHLDDY